jgi:hypothetical protein
MRAASLFALWPPQCAKLIRGNATLCVSPIAIVHDGCRRFRRLREKMFNVDYVANNIVFLQNCFTGIIRTMHRNYDENYGMVASWVREFGLKMFTNFGPLSAV